MLEVEGLTKRYGSREAVKGISFRVNEGEIVGFLGPNGAGKSTTLRMITGFLAPSAGRVRVADIDAVADPFEARRHFGYMPEGVPLHEEMRVHEHLRFRAELRGIRGRAKLDAAVERSLQQASVEDARDRIIGQLSKGYRQRVGLADALLTDPPLLILDEPTSGLDPNQIRAVRSLIRGFAGKKTVFLSTHILPEVEATCGRVVILDAGRVVGEGDPRELRGGGGAVVVRIVGRGEPSAYEAAFGSLGEVTAAIEAAPSGPSLVVAKVRTRGEDASERVFEAAVTAGLKLRELSVEATSLEDVFAALTTEEPTNEEAA
ncbi:MAG: ATP-binding cassette domain-containing protein [Myxococcales bacterium]|nr:ATP-binding cassette domain-containing protein [Myxococcales bacterium]